MMLEGFSRSGKERSPEHHPMTRACRRRPDKAAKLYEMGTNLFRRAKRRSDLMRVDLVGNWSRKAPKAGCPADLALWRRVADAQLPARGVGFAAGLSVALAKGLGRADGAPG
jgi:hypothetical protein